MSVAEYVEMTPEEMEICNLVSNGRCYVVQCYMRQRYRGVTQSSPARAEHLHCGTREDTYQYRNQDHEPDLNISEQLAKV